MSLWSTLRSLFSRSGSGVLAAEPRTDTEFVAEVVTVIGLEEHGNADKLEIVRIALEGSGPAIYQIVARKGDFQIGQRAGYFSVDCIVPTSRSEFAFLLKRVGADGKAFSRTVAEYPRHRLKAARLRGVFSQGLLVPVDQNLAQGSSLVSWGITYHTDELPSNGPTAPSRVPRVQPAPKYAVDSMRKLPNLFDPKEPVFVTEKIHGTNFRFGWVKRKLWGIPMGYRFFVGSHNVEKGRGTGSYYGEDLYSQAAQMAGLKELTRGHKGLVFYGELYGYTFSGTAIQPKFTYGPNVGGPKLAVFDIWDADRKFWYTIYERVDVLVDLNLAGPPMMPGSGSTYEEAIETVKEYDGRQSLLANDTLMEGVVIESQDRRKKAKLVFQAYLEQK